MYGFKKKKVTKAVDRMKQTAAIRSPAWERMWLLLLMSR